MVASVAFPPVLLLLLLLYCQSLVPVYPASFNSTLTDQEALVSIKRLITSETSNALSSWKERSTFCNWEGVSCDIRKQRVTALDLQNKRLTGTIPIIIGRLSNLELLNLNDNSISGNIPPEIGQLRQLKMLGLAGNKLSGKIPLTFGNFQRLQSLDLSNNKLNGGIPKQIFSLSSLESILNLSKNSLTGPLPSEVGNLVKLEVMDVSDNQLSGIIPESIGNCKSLQEMFMAKNSFSESIPANLGELGDLQILDLSSNQLSGAIPDNIWELQALRFLNLSFNDLQGEIPGDFPNLTTIDLSGNTKICQSEANQEFRACDTRDARVSNSLVLINAVSIIKFLIFCIFILGSAWIYVSKSTTEVEEIESFHGRHTTESYEEIDFVTGYFTTDNLIGTGSFSSVYRGTLGDGTQVAIKVFNLQQHGAYNSFLSECEALRNIRHRNIVNLITSCTTTDFKHGEFRSLVFELMPNGSLDKWLDSEKQDEDRFWLNLIERLEIAIDIASALDYLHHDCETPVVHCDLKPSNVFLDSNKTAKIGDFGLAGLITVRSVDQQSSMVSLEGSIGYTAPEYGIGGEPSTEGDVYSYGIMILELFTGKSPIHETFTGDVSIQKWVDTNFPNKIMDLVDPELQLMEDLSFNGRTISWKQQEDCLISVIAVALSCVVESPDLRASMRDVLPKLKEIKDDLMASSIHQQLLLQL